MTKFMTVVIKYEEGAELPKKLTKALTESGEFEDAEITAISLEDEISRVEQLEVEHGLMSNSKVNQLCCEISASRNISEIDRKLEQLKAALGDSDDSGLIETVFEMRNALLELNQVQERDEFVTKKYIELQKKVGLNQKFKA
ncbi:hypothetical protein FG475_15070 [Vibrio navarrensis]|nr:hypothetical protein [Vibrio navarrensis]